MSHTPGPWRVAEHGFITSDAQGYVPINTPYRERAFMGDRGKGLVGTPIHPSEEIMANARLIAAAPALLEALKSFITPTASRRIPSHADIEEAIIAIESTKPKRIGE